MIDSLKPLIGHTLSLRTLKAFIVVAEELHFGRAAERLHMTQPPLSQQIRQLEATLGVELFSRTTRSVQLTPAGSTLLACSRQLLAESDSLVNAVRRAARGEAGALTISFTSSVAYQLLPTAIRAFRLAHPDIELRFNEMHSAASIEALRSRSIDVALLRPTPDLKYLPDLDISLVRRDPLMLAMPRDHPLAALARVPLAALDGQDFVHFSRVEGRYLHEIIERQFFEHGVRPQVVGESLMPSLLSLVEAGLGVALVPASAASMNFERVVHRPVEGADGVHFELYGVRRKDIHNPSAAAMIDTLIAAGGHNAGPGAPAA